MSTRAPIPDAVFRQTISAFLEPIAPLLADDAVSDILINGLDPVYAERGGRMQRTGCRFEAMEDLEAAIKNIAQFVGKRVGADAPLLDARLPDGSRVQITMPPCATRGPYVSIRRFRRDAMTLDALAARGALTPEAVAFIGASVVAARNVLVAGGTGSGKTTLLNALSGFLPDMARIVVIEDAAELALQKDHVLSLESRPPDREGRGGVSVRDLLRATLRMRPDRIVIGEVRAAEALDLIQAMTSGHRGSMSTVHASGPRDALRRLETMAMMAGERMPLDAVRAQIASGIDLVIHAGRLEDGSRRVTRITAVEDDLNPGGDYALRDIFALERLGRTREGRVEARLRPTGQRPPHWEEMLAIAPDFDPGCLDPAST